MSCSNTEAISRSINKFPTPTVLQFWSSFYRNTTHLEQIDLHTLVTENPQSDPAIHKEARNLSSRGFQEPSSHYKNLSFHPIQDNPAFLAHPGELCRSTCYDDLLELALIKRIEKVYPKLVPICSIGELDPQAVQTEQRFCLIRENRPLKDPAGTLNFLASQSEKAQLSLAKEICHYIKEIGVADATFDTINVDTLDQLVFKKLRPLGLFVAKNDNQRTRGHSVEKCARVGLFTLMQATHDQLKHYPKLAPFAQEVKRQYYKSLSDYSWFKITLSILCPLIPLILLIISIYKTYQFNTFVNGLSAEDPSALERYYNTIEDIIIV